MGSCVPDFGHRSGRTVSRREFSLTSLDLARLWDGVRSARLRKHGAVVELCLIHDLNGPLGVRLGPFPRIVIVLHLPPNHQLLCYLNGCSQRRTAIEADPPSPLYGEVPLRTILSDRHRPRPLMGASFHSDGGKGFVFRHLFFLLLDRLRIDRGPQFSRQPFLRDLDPPVAQDVS